MQKTIIHSKQLLDKINQLDRKVKSIRMQFIYYFIPKRGKITDSKDSLVASMAKHQDPIDDILDWEQYERDLADAHLEKR